MWESCPSPFSSVLRAPRPLYCVSFSVPCLLFFFFSPRLSRGLCWFIPGVAVGIPGAASLLTCWPISPKHVRSWCLAVREPSWFLSVTWHGGHAVCFLSVIAILCNKVITHNHVWFKKNYSSLVCFKSEMLDLPLILGSYQFLSTAVLCTSIYHLSFLFWLLNLKTAVMRLFTTVIKWENNVKERIIYFSSQF
jgi:hypothetical protein